MIGYGSFDSEVRTGDAEVVITGHKAVFAGRCHHGVSSVVLVSNVFAQVRLDFNTTYADFVTVV